MSQIVIRYTELPWNDRNRIVLFFLSNSLFTIPFFYKTWIGVDFFFKIWGRQRPLWWFKKLWFIYIYFLFLNHFFILVVSSPLVSSILARLASAIAIKRCNICRNFITCKKMNNKNYTCYAPSPVNVSKWSQETVNYIIICEV